MTERHETSLSSALSQLDADIEVPSVDPAREQALLAAFDAYWARPRPAPRAWAWTAAAAMAAVTVGVGWFGVYRAPRVVPAVDVTAGTSDFLPWPGAQALPPLESGSLIRIDLPVAALPALGFAPPSAAVRVVQADIVVGQDGFARAVRLVQ